MILANSTAYLGEWLEWFVRAGVFFCVVVVPAVAAYVLWANKTGRW